MTTSAARAIAKTPTGIAGFDELSEGGIPTGAMTAIVGDPGSGKTAFALQTLVNGFRHRGERGVMVSFEEPKERIRHNFASFDWGFSEIGDDDIHIIDGRLPIDVVRSGVFDVSGLLSVLSGIIADAGARNFVFDGIDVLLSVLNDEALERQEIVRLGEWVRGSEVTALVTVKTFGASLREQQRSDFLQYMTDCTVTFQGFLSATAFSRTLRVAKYRGSSFAANPAPFIIGPSGIEVIGIAGARSNHPTFSERVSSGIARLDEKLAGGYPRGSCTLVSGAPGTSKTSLAASFAVAACQRGERALFVSFDESGSQIVTNMKSIGLDLGAHVHSGLLAMESLISGGRSPEEHYAAIRASMARQRPKFLVIDPLSALLKSDLPFAQVVCERILEQAKVEGITVLCTSLLEKANPADEISASHVSTIADTWLHVSFQALAGERNRALTIVKSRGTPHSNQVCELVLGSGGIQVVDVYSAEGDVLMGSARQQKIARDRRDQVEREMIERGERFELERNLAELGMLADKAAMDLEWKRRQSELFDLNQKTIRENALSDAEDRLAFRTNRIGRR
jgi:circadian clock protein KaiC